MKTDFARIVLPQIDHMIVKYRDVISWDKSHDFSSVEDLEAISEFLTGSIALLERLTGSNSQYIKQAHAALEKSSIQQWGALPSAVPAMGGILQTFRHAIEAGYLVSIQELIHANLFSNFLDMARHLLEEGYKDPSAVLIGSTLEEHIRNLCSKHQVDIEVTDARGTRPKKADVLNADLTKAGVYSKLDQKNITAWLDLRNKAAHGKYTEYTQQQVELLLQSVSDFITRHPA